MYEDYNEKLEREYEELLFKLRSSERTHAKEMMELKILYEAEKDKAESLEESLSQYPQLMLKVRELQNKLKSASNKIKMQKTTIEELTSSHSQKHIVQRLETELQNFRVSSTEELRLKEHANQKLTTELEQYKRAVEQFSMENRSIRQTLNNEKDEKEEILQQKFNLETNLKEAKGVIVQLNEQLLERIEEIKAEEDRKIQERKSIHDSELDKLQAKVVDCNEEINTLNSKIKELKNSRNKVAAIVEQHEQTILNLKQDKEILIKDFRSKEKQVLELQGVIENQAEDVEAEMEQYRQETLKESNSLLKEAKEVQRELQDNIEQRDEEIYSLKINIRDLNREKESFEKDKSLLKEKIKEIESLNRDLREKLRQTEENTQTLVNQAKEELNPLIMKLKSDKRELEHRIDELISQIEITRNSIMAPGATLFDEISENPDNEVVYFCRQSIGLSQQKVEDLRVELSQKDYDLKILIKEKEDLLKENDRLYTENTHKAEIEEQTALLKNNFELMKKEKKTIEKENAMLKDNIVEFNALNTDLKAKIKYFEVKEQEIDPCLTQARDERDSFQRQVEELMEKIQTYEKADKDSVISELNNKLQELEESSKEVQDKLKGKIRCLKDDYSLIEDEFKEIMAKLKQYSYKSEVEDLGHLISVIDREIESAGEYFIENLENQIDRIESSLSFLGNQIQAYQDKEDCSPQMLENMKKEYTEKESQLNSLKDSHSHVSFIESLKTKSQNLKSQRKTPQEKQGTLSEIVYLELSARDKTILELLRSNHELELLCENLQLKPNLEMYSDHLLVQTYSNEKEQLLQTLSLEKESSEADCKKLQNELNQLLSDIRARKDNIDISRLSDVNLEQSSKVYSIDSIPDMATIPSTMNEKTAKIDVLLQEIEQQRKKFESLSKEHQELVTDYQILEDYIHDLRNKSNIFEACSQVEVLATQIETVRQSISQDEQPKIQDIQEECERLRKELQDLQENIKQQSFKLDISRRSEVHLENTKKFKLSSTDTQNNIQISAEKPQKIEELMKEIQSKNSTIDSLCKEHSELVALHEVLQEHMDALRNRTNIVEVCSQAEVLATHIESAKHSISIETEPIETIKKDLTEMLSQTNPISLDLSRRSDVHLVQNKEFVREMTVENQVSVQSSVVESINSLQKEIMTKDTAIETLCKEQSQLISQCQSLQQDLDKFNERSNIFEVYSQAEVFASQLNKIRESLSPEAVYKIQELETECNNLKDELQKLADSAQSPPVLDISRRSEVNLEQILKQKEMSFESTVEIPVNYTKSQQIDNLQNELHSKNNIIDTLCKDHSDLVLQYQSLQDNIESVRNKEKIIEVCSSAEILAFKLEETRQSLGQSAVILETQQECEKLKQELEMLRKNISTQNRTLDISRRSEVLLEKVGKTERNLSFGSTVEVPSSFNKKDRELSEAKGELESKVLTIQTLKKEQEDLKEQCKNLQEVIDSFKNRSRIVEVCSQAGVIASQIESIRQSVSPEERENIREIHNECERLRNELENLQSSISTASLEVSRRSDVYLERLTKPYKQFTVESEVEIASETNLKQNLQNLQISLSSKDKDIEELKNEHSNLKEHCRSLQETIDSLNNKTNKIELCSQAEVIATKLESVRESITDKDKFSEIQQECENLKRDLLDLQSTIRSPDLEISRRSEILLERAEKTERNLSFGSTVEVPSSFNKKDRELSEAKGELESKVSTIQTLKKEQEDLKEHCESLQEVIDSFKNRSRILEACSQAEVIVSQIESIRQSVSPDEQENIREIQDECERLRNELENLQSSISIASLEVSRRSDVYLERLAKPSKQLTVESEVAIASETNLKQNLQNLQISLSSKDKDIEELKNEHSNLKEHCRSLQETIDSLNNKTNDIELCSQAEVIVTKLESVRESITDKDKFSEIQQECENLKRDLLDLQSTIRSPDLEISRRSEILLERAEKTERNLSFGSTVEVPSSFNKKDRELSEARGELESKVSTIQILKKEQEDLKEHCESLQEVIDSFKNRSRIVEVCSQAEVIASQIESIRQSVSPDEQENIREIQDECERLRNELENLQSSISTASLEVSRRSDVYLERLAKPSKQLTVESEVAIASETNLKQNLQNLQISLSSKDKDIEELKNEHSNLKEHCRSLQETIDSLNNKTNDIELCSQAEVIATKLESVRESITDKDKFSEIQQECENLKRDLLDLQSTIRSPDLEISRRSEILLERAEKTERNLSFGSTVEVPSSFNKKDRELSEAKGELESKVSTIQTLKKEQENLKEHCESLQEVIDSFKNRSRILEACSQAEVIVSQIESIRQSVSPDEEIRIQEIQEECEKLRDELERLKSKMGALEIARRSDVGILKPSKPTNSICSELNVEIKSKFSLKSQQIEDLEAEVRMKQSTIEILQSKLDSMAKKPAQLVEVSEFQEVVIAEKKFKEKDVLADIPENQFEESKEMTIERLRSEKVGLENERESLQKELQSFKKPTRDLLLNTSEINSEFERPSTQSNFTLTSPTNAEVFIQNSDFHSPKFNANVNLLEVEAERDRYKAEMQKLKTQLTLNIQNMAFSNNQLSEQLEKEQKDLVKLQIKVKKLEERDLYYRKALEDKKNKVSWWKKKFGGNKK